MDSKSQNTSNANKTRITIISLSLLYAGVNHWLIGLPSGPGTIVLEVLHDALILSMLFLLLERLVDIERVLDPETITSPARQIEAKHDAYLMSDHGVLSRLIEVEYRKWLGALEFIDDGFRLTGACFAIESYIQFWHDLAHEQIKRKQNGKPPLNVFAIHSCQMKIWIDSERAPQLKKHQRNFIRADGVIQRILCEEDEPSRTAHEACAIMNEIGVNVSYYRTASKDVSFTFTWDFLYIKETEQAVIWESPVTGGPGGPILKAVYVDSLIYDHHELPDLWKDIKDSSRPFPGA